MHKGGDRRKCMKTEVKWYSAVSEAAQAMFKVEFTDVHLHSAETTRNGHHNIGNIILCLMTDYTVQ